MDRDSSGVSRTLTFGAAGPLAGTPPSQFVWIRQRCCPSDADSDEEVAGMNWFDTITARLGNKPADDESNDSARTRPAGACTVPGLSFDTSTVLRP